MVMSKEFLEARGARIGIGRQSYNGPSGRGREIRRGRCEQHQRRARDGERVNAMPESGEKPQAGGGDSYRNNHGAGFSILSIGGIA